MNIGSIIGLGCICQPFTAGLITLSGGHQWRSIDPWIHQSRSVDPEVSGSKCPVPRGHSTLTPFPHMVLGGTPGHGGELGAAGGADVINVGEGNIRRKRWHS